MAERYPMQEAPSLVSVDSFVSSRSLIDTVSAIPVPKVEVAVDSLIPKQIAMKIELGAEKKAKELGWWYTVLLAWHGGLFFGLGAAFYGVVLTGTTHWGLQRFAAGIAYTTGISMVVMAGGELFTTNIMMLMAWFTKRVSMYQIIWNWLLVFFGNLAGCLSMAAVQTWGRTHENASYALAKTMMDIADDKCRKQWGACFAQAVFSNALMCWAVWMAAGARTASDKQLVLIMPVACFAAMGYEHIVSNFYFIPVALMIQTYAFPLVWQKLGAANDPTLIGYNSVTQQVDPLYQYKNWPNVSVSSMIYNNFIPTTCGNIAGAVLFLVVEYWYLFLRDPDHRSRFHFKLGNSAFLASGNDALRKKKRKPHHAEAVPVSAPPSIPANPYAVAQPAYIMAQPAYATAQPVNAAQPAYAMAQPTFSLPPAVPNSPLHK